MSQAGTLAPPDAHRLSARTPCEFQTAPAGRMIGIVFSELHVRRASAE